VLVTAAVAGAGNGELRGLGLGATTDPVRASGTVLASLVARPDLIAVAAALALGAAVLPLARHHGPWGLALLGALVLPAVLVVPSTAQALALAAAVWLTCGGLAAVDAGVLERRLE
jgi:hypothetical protein